ncbi:ankyrin repeat, PH and SEC7 domain containing protein secG-like [Watersipora subatra]|uniref:ankyrin repeat, PH and SEC7 domain containing protein secG-like n=1 Tax=Watersipora subatra TaxID=2589382 RepID=UPI00355B1BE3
MPALRAAVETVQPSNLLKRLITIRDDSYTAIMVAAVEDHTETCRLLLSPIRKTADKLLWMKRKDGCTVLHLAVRKGSSECVELLMDIVSDEKKYKFVAEKNKYGNTAIAEAALCGSSKCTESLLYSFFSPQRDCLLNIQNNNLYTPLHRAAYHGQTTALKVMLGSTSLVAVSSLLNIKNSDNRTPLEEAEYMGNKESLELLKRWPQESVLKGRFVIQGDTTLDDAKQRITTLQIESDQKLSALQKESDQKVSALQRHTQQQAEALVEARQQVTMIREDSERTLSLVQEETRQQRTVNSVAAATENLPRPTLKVPGDLQFSPTKPIRQLDPNQPTSG